jgi:hypothetical protein
MATQPQPVDHSPFAEEPTQDEADLAAKEKLNAAFQGVLDRLQRLANKRVSDRSPIEQRWLLDLRQYHGRFDEATEAALRATPEKSRAIINMTRPKTKAWAARLSDLLFPADDKNWGISPTPVPELTERAKEAAAQAEQLHEKAAQMVDIHNRDQAAGTQTMPPGQAIQQAAALGAKAMDLDQAEADARAEMDVAKRTSENMSREIDDQLTQCQYPRHSRRSIDDLCKLGSGVMKGPLNGNAAQRWKKVAGIMGQDMSSTGGNVYQLAPVVDGNSPIALRVDPWSFFPDSNATDMESSESELERHLPNKTQLKRLAKLLDFDPDAVSELCRDGPGYGAANDLNYLAQLRTITDELSGVVDRYILWEFHGPLEADEIEIILNVMQGPEAAKKWRDDYSELDEVRVIIFFCDGKLLKIEPDWLLDTNETLYSVASFEKSESSVLGGYGVPAMMRDPARAVAAAWRMLLDNAGLSVGPQVVIDKSRVSPENGSWKLEPRKVWTKTGDDINTDAKPFEVFNIPSNTQELVQVIELALKFVDETTSLPLIAQGEQGSHITQTAGGMSMLMNSANVIFRNVVKNWDDDMTTPLVRRFYDWNMQFNPKEEIKGDMQVEARGTSALLVRELQSQNLMVMTERWSSHPVLSLAMDIYSTMRMTIQSLSINPDDVLGTKDEFEAKLKQQAESAQQDPRIVAAQTLAASNEKIAGIRTQGALQVAEASGQAVETAAQIKAGISEQDLEGKMGIVKLQIASEERQKAVDIAVEDNRAAEARAEGKPAETATGKGIG